VATLTQGDAAQHAASADRPDVPLWRQKSIGMLERGPEREAAAHPRRYTFLICLLIFSNANEQLILSKKKERKNEFKQKDSNNCGSIIYNCDGCECARIYCYFTPYSKCSKLSC